MKRSQDPDKWTIDEKETAAIAQMLRDLLFLDDSEKATGLFPRRKLRTKTKQALKKRKELFRHSLRWYTHKRYI